ncbi:acyl carrier protein [Streptoalloteichus hindustanus]|uniref:acyl carrier protein n=1 Tax=Streptoalloteichus hindustanus TaxID=2017 RepID=UPI000936CFA9|nr:acyl carrier protein [Streptoalloteichus hindustanus]
MPRHQTTERVSLVAEDVLAALREYVLRHVLKDDHVEIDGRTPLLEWGVLNSLTTAELVAHIRTRFDVLVPPEKVHGAHFRNLDAVTALVVDLHGERAVHN